jgi:hypothetical protein
MQEEVRKTVNNHKRQIFYAQKVLQILTLNSQLYSLKITLTMEAKLKSKSIKENYIISETKQ